MSDVPRDPGLYHPTDHAVQQAKYRGIDWPEVAKCIQTGRIKNSHKDHCKLFIMAVEHREKPLAIVANTNDGRILTVEWRK